MKDCDPDNMTSLNDNDQSPQPREDKNLADITQNPLHEVVLTSFSLGIVLGSAFGSLMITPLKNFNFYVTSLCLFHFLEYYITAKYNPRKVNKDSFLLRNGAEYLISHSIAFVECALEYMYAPSYYSNARSKLTTIIVILGYTFIIVGQLARSLAMFTAGKSFSHVVQKTKDPDHVLVKNGIYKYLRHPSYFGFFWWALGTQMILLNPLSFLLFVIVLWRFFNHRIILEEAFLIKFFGDEYLQYKAHVPVRIPFIK